MKVLFLTMWYPNVENPIFGTFVHEQIIALQNLGIDVRVVQPIPIVPFPMKYFNKRYKTISSIDRKETYKGVIVYHPRYLTLPRNIQYHRNGEWMYRGIQQTLLNIYKEWRFQIIHAHATFPCGWAANKIRLNHLPNIKTLHTIHRMSIIDVPNYNKKCYDNVVQSLHEADSNVFVSSEGVKTAKEMTKKYPMKDKHYITNGVNLARFDMNEADVLEYQDIREKYKDSINIVFIGYLIERKGIRELLNAVLKIKQVYTGKKLRFFLIGRNMMGDYIANFIEKNNLRAWVNLTGPVLHDKIKIWLRFADIFILPSHSEGLATVLFEALYMKNASIFTNVGGTCDVATHMKNALIIEPGSVDQITDSILMLINDSELRITLGENGHELIKNKYTWDINARKNLKIYKKMIKEHLS